MGDNGWVVGCVDESWVVGLGDGSWVFGWVDKGRVGGLCDKSRVGGLGDESRVCGWVDKSRVGGLDESRRVVLEWDGWCRATGTPAGQRRPVAEVGWGEGCPSCGWRDHGVGWGGAGMDAVPRGRVGWDGAGSRACVGHGLGVGAAGWGGFRNGCALNCLRMLITDVAPL